MRTIALCTLLGLASLTSISQVRTKNASRLIAITHVTVIDATGSPAMPDMTVVITDDRITNLGKTGKVRVPKGAEVVDGSGKFLIPGLWDMHVHLSITTESTLPAFIANGVTGVRDMGGDLSQLDGCARVLPLAFLLVRASSDPARLLMVPKRQRCTD